MASSIALISLAHAGATPYDVLAAVNTQLTAAINDVNTLQTNVAALQGGTVAGTPPVHVVDLATTAALPTGTYSAGVFTVTATGTLTIDGVLTTLGQRILVANQATQSQNGIYSVTTAGAIGVQAVLTRATDAAVTADFQPGMIVSATAAGTVNGGAVYTFTSAAGFVLDTNNATYAKVGSTNEFAKAVSLQAPQASTASSVAEIIIGMFSGAGTIVGVYFVPFANSAPASGSNSQAMTLTRYNASGSSQGTVATATLNNANQMTKGARFTLGTISNGTYADGDIITSQTTVTGTATLPAGAWVVVATPN